MNWIILALTLGVSITSIMHGGFMLLNILQPTGPLVGLPSTLVASLPIAAALIALIGGIMAFNQSKWGSLFLLLAAGICAVTRDTWPYAGLYVFAGLFCFFLKKRQDDYRDLYDDEYDSDSGIDSGSQNLNARGQEDFYYQEYQGSQTNNNNHHEDFTQDNQQQIQRPNINLDTLDDGGKLEFSQPSITQQKTRGRNSKTCPYCGMNVPREANFCYSCGAKLFVNPELLNEDQGIPDIINKPAEELEAVNINQPEAGEESQSVINPVNSNVSEDDEMTNAGVLPDYRVRVNPGRSSRNYQSRNDLDEAASSYQEFSSSRYTKRGKNRKRSPFRRLLGILLLVGAVGGALYFLLSLRKVPPQNLPPIVKTEFIPQIQRRQQTPSQDISIAEPVDNNLVVNENILPNFTPDRTPKSGIITGNGVNVRADHSTGSARVTRLSAGSRVEVFDSWTGRSGNLNGTWYNIRTNGREGWVYGQYMQPIGGGIPEGYSNALIKSLGNNRTQLIESLGQPTKSSSNSAEWQGLTATFRGEDITRLRISNSRYELQNGLKTGMSQTALLQIMGYPSSMSNRVMNYNEGNSTGVSVQLDRNNSITSITLNEIR